MPETSRLNKYLALQLGLSRRQADEYIEQGKVLVNNQPARLGQVIETAKDAVTVDGAPVSQAPKQFTYLLVNKPVGYVCSRRQQGENPTVYDLLPAAFHSLKIAGRLDADSSGLLLLTDDGDTILKLTHPRYGKQKTYQVTLDRPLAETDQLKIQSGVELEDGLSKLTLSQPQERYWLVTMHMGRNRQIRRTFKALGYNVKRLQRLSLGQYNLDQLKGKPYLQI